MSGLILSRRAFLSTGAGLLAVAGCGDSSYVPQGDAVLRTPIHLTTAGTVVSGSGGGSIDYFALRNPFRDRPIEITEIKWGIRSIGKALGAGIGCNLMLGNTPLTNGYVPINCFCPSKNIVLAEERFGNGTTTDSFAEFTWTPPVPIYVPPDMSLMPKFEHRNLIGKNVDMRISYAGEVLPVGTRYSKVRVPWVTAWIAPTMAYESADANNSVPDDLGNRWTEPLIVQRLIGRYVVFDSSSIVASERGVATRAGFPEVGGNMLQVRIAQSDGAEIIPRLSRFNMVFDHQTRSLEMGNAVLPPSAYYQAFVEQAAGGAGGTGYTVQPFIGLVGWREISA